MGVWIFIIAAVLCVSQAAEITLSPKTLEKDTPITVDGEIEGKFIFFTKIEGDCTGAAINSTEITFNQTIFPPQNEEGIYYVCLGDDNSEDSLFVPQEGLKIQVVGSFSSVVTGFDQPSLCSSYAELNITAYGAFEGETVFLTNDGTCTNSSAAVPLDAEAKFPLPAGLESGEYKICWSGIGGVPEYVVQEPSLIILELIELNVTVKNVKCHQWNITVAVGVGNYTYSWEGPIPIDSTSNTASNLPAGNYTITVTDENGCSKKHTTEITQPAEFILGTLQQKDVTCYGGSDGSATVEASGGTPPYKYVWTGVVSDTATASGLKQGNYTVIATDQNNCSEHANIEIGQPKQPLKFYSTINSTQNSF